MTNRMTDPQHRDALGVEIKVGDRAYVTAHGGSVRLSDVRTGLLVTGFTPRGNVRHDSEAANGRAIWPGILSVCRRDGEPGWEGNLPEYREAFRASVLGAS